MSEESAQKIYDRLFWIAVWCFFTTLNTCDVKERIAEVRDAVKAQHIEASK